MRTRILVTGANGHIGANTIRALLKKGYDVNAYVRKNSALHGLTGLPITLHTGDIRDRESLIKAAIGCEAIIHHAAVYNVASRKPQEITEPAIEGTKNIFSAAAHAGIQRLVYTSSTYAIGNSKDPKTILTEKDWSNNKNILYGVTKTSSEKLAWELAEKNKVPMISLCLAAVLGRYDYKVTPSNRLIFDMLKGAGLTVEGSLSIVDARDAGELHALAVTKGKTGERYIVSQGYYTMKEIGELTARLSGKKVRHLPFSRGINMATAVIMEFFGKLTGWDPPFNVGLAREFSHRHVRVDNSKIKNDFNYNFYSPEDSIRDTIKWFSFINNKVRLSKEIREEFQPEPGWIHPAAPIVPGALQQIS